MFYKDLSASITLTFYEETSTKVAAIHMPIAHAIIPETSVMDDTALPKSLISFLH
jgi:hypothetical protein